MTRSGHPRPADVSRTDQGYILASVIGVLLAISIVAAALVGASGEAASRLRRAEDAGTRDAILRSAVLVLTTQLALDTRRRVVDLDKTSGVEILGQTVRFRIAWETNKLDINRADASAVERRLQAAGVSSDLRAAVTARISEARASGKPISLLGNIAPQPTAEDCLASLLTVFGGVADHDPENPGDAGPIGRPAVGSKIALDVAVAGEEAQGLSVVVLLTGDAAAPWQVMDWRPSSVLNGEACDENQT